MLCFLLFFYNIFVIFYVLGGKMWNDAYMQWPLPKGVVEI